MVILTSLSPATDDEPESSSDEAGDWPSLPLTSKPSDVGPGSATDRGRARRAPGSKRHGTTLQDGTGGEDAAASTAQGTNSGLVFTTPPRRSTRKLPALSSRVRDGHSRQFREPHQNCMADLHANTKVLKYSTPSIAYIIKLYLT